MKTRTSPVAPYLTEFETPDLKYSPAKTLRHKKFTLLCNNPENFTLPEKQARSRKMTVYVFNLSLGVGGKAPPTVPGVKTLRR